MLYHYAPHVGVVKAIARFILYDSEGLETVNRLVETGLKSALVQGTDVRCRFPSVGQSSKYCLVAS